MPGKEYWDFFDQWEENARCEDVTYATTLTEKLQMRAPTQIRRYLKLLDS